MVIRIAETKENLLITFSDEKIIEDNYKVKKQKDISKYALVLSEMETQLKLKGYSSKTNIAYLGHAYVRRFYDKYESDIIVLQEELKGV